MEAKKTTKVMGYTINYHHVSDILDNPVGLPLFIRPNMETTEIADWDYNTIIAYACFRNTKYCHPTDSIKLLIFKDKEDAIKCMEAYKDMIASMPSHMQKHFGINPWHQFYTVEETSIKKLMRTVKNRYIIR